ncbi:MAG: metalloregulator ArsR/SmtB family transcription factor [bacterium]|nr:metalloregulator ArsR/SmtB family transcription factor [bacterium]
MSSDILQKVFKTLSDPTRVRILALLAREELAVQELMEVLGMAQSRVSRHLGILREAGLLSDRRDGTFVFYRFQEPEVPTWRDAWALVEKALRDDPAARRDGLAVARVLEARAARSRTFFDSVGPEWDALRKVWGDELLRARALTRLVPKGLRVADVGTGTGVFALELAQAGLDVVAIDHSAAMLEAARSKIDEREASSIELRVGDASNLPLDDSEVDAAFAHMVLQYLASPNEAVAEMARVTAPGGCVVVIDFVRHDREWMREELGVQWLGFPQEEIQASLEAAGLEEIQIDLQPAASRGADLPETFIASARRASNGDLAVSDRRPPSETSP